MPSFLICTLIQGIHVSSRKLNFDFVQLIHERLMHCCARSLPCDLQVKMAPKAVSQREESELQAMLERLALENEEIDGDAPEDV